MGKKKKILFLLHDSRRSGVPLVATQIIMALPKEFFCSTTLFAYDGIYADELRSKGYRVLTFGPRTPLLWRAKRFLMLFYLMIYGRRYDLIHVHSIRLAWLSFAAKFMGLKVIMHVHELKYPANFMMRKAFMHADCTIFCSRTCADYYIDVPAKRKITLVNALKFNEIQPVIHSNGKLRIIMAGSINKKKGQDILLDAFSKIANKNAELWFYGTVGLSARIFVKRLKRRVEVLGLKGRVFFPGPTKEIRKILMKTSILVHTSRLESFGMALVEAQSCGVPVIANNLGGMREVVLNEESGYLIEPEDVLILVEKLNVLLSSKCLRKRMGGNGYKFVRENFNINDQVDYYCQLYEEIGYK